MRTIDLLKDLFCPHHYTLLSYAKRLAYARAGSIYTDFSTYGVYAVLRCTRCGLTKTEFIRQATSYGARDVPSVETALAEIRTARKLLSETATELNLGRHYTGREYEDD